MLVTKEDLKEEMKNVATKEDIQKVLEAADNITKKFDDHETEHTANLGAHKRIERRIKKIEKHVGLETANAEI
jgi:hypothetical protein